MKSRIARGKRRLSRAYGLAWLRLHKSSYSIRAWIHRHKPKVATAASVLITAGAFAIHQPLNRVIGETLRSNNEEISSAHLALGGSLIGAVAISFSLILFAMQINVERTPHGLFRKLSSDIRLLSAFIATFVLSISILGLSLVTDPQFATARILATGLFTLSIVLLILASYIRALSLINPVKQLQFLRYDTLNELKKWDRMATRARPLLQDDEPSVSANDTKKDIEKAAFFRLNPSWTTNLRKALQHCVSFSRRYSELGDHEMSSAALETLIRLNADYISLKDATFFAQNPFFDNKLSADVVITETLEHLRQNIQVGLSRGDEQLVSQSLRSFNGLAMLYLAINYADENESKSHAQLAVAYLRSAALKVVPHKLTDVLMESVRLIGNATSALIAHDRTAHSTLSIQDLAKISAIGFAQEDFRPVTVEGMKSLSDINLSLLASRHSDVGYISNDVHTTLSTLVDICLKFPDKALGSGHQNYFTHYYSERDFDTQIVRIKHLANSVIGADGENEDARQVIGNLIRWCERLSDNHRHVVTKCFTAKSSLYFDVLHFAAELGNILVGLRNAPACPEHYKVELQRTACRQLAAAGNFTSDKDTLVFCENWKFTDTVFEAGCTGLERDCREYTDTAEKILFRWAGCNGNFKETREAFSKSLLALCVLQLEQGRDGSAVANFVTEKIAAQSPLDPGARERAHLSLSRLLERGPRDLYSASSINRRLSKLKREAVYGALSQVVEALRA